MALAQYEVIKYLPRHRSDVVELQKYLWSSNTAVNSSYFTWKYEDNPFSDEPLIYLVRSGNRIIAMRGFHGAEWQIGDNGPVRIPCAGDMVALPEHRGRGVFRRVMSAAFSDLPLSGHYFTFNFSASPVTYIRSLRSGWRLAFTFDLLKRPPDDRSINPHETPTDVYLQGFDERSASCGRKSSRVSAGTTPDAADMATLVRKISSKKLIRHTQNRAYFDWRFKNPLSRYRFLYWRDTELQGYLVLQYVYTTPESGVRLVDWQASSLSVFEDLLDSALRWNAHLPAAIWSAGLSDDQLAILHRLGFKSFGESNGHAWFRPGLIVAQTDPANDESEWLIAGREILDLQSWELRMIYSDYF